MDTVLNVLLIIISMVFISFIIITYRWTFTPLGRIDYLPAIISKITQRQPLPGFTEEERVESNKWTKRILGASDASQLASVKDYKVRVENGTITARVYTPKGDGPFPMLLEIHGGGFWMGNDFSMEKPILEMAAKIPAVVVSVDYRLTPEHIYPTQLNDCEKALDWAIENSELLLIDSSRIAIMGASAGGNLASALTLKLRDEGGPEIKFQFLSVPFVDLVNFDWDSFQEAGDNYMCKATDLKEMGKKYAPEPEVRKSMYASPLLAPSHKELPPALVITAQFDPLRDQGKMYAAKLKDSGVETTYMNIQGSIHGFIGSKNGMRQHQEAAISKIREALYS